MFFMLTCEDREVALTSRTQFHTHLLGIPEICKVIFNTINKIIIFISKKPHSRRYTFLEWGFPILIFFLHGLTIVVKRTGH